MSTSKHPPSKLIQNLLISNGYVKDPNTVAGNQIKCFVGFLPDLAPEAQLAVFDTAPKFGGSGDLRSDVDRYPEYPGIQIFMRAQDYPTGWALMDELKKFLDTLTDAVITENSDVFILKNVNRRTGVLSLGVETIGSDRRNLFSLNVFLHIKPFVSN